VFKATEMKKAAARTSTSKLCHFIYGSFQFGSFLWLQIQIYGLAECTWHNFLMIKISNVKKIVLRLKGPI